MLYGGGGGLMVLLFSAIGGYWLLERAENHKGELRRIGRLLGGLVIVLGLVGLIASAWGGCPLNLKRAGWSCPFSKGMHHATMEPDTIMVTPEPKKRR